MAEAHRRGTSRSVTYVVLALALVAGGGGTYVALGFTASTARDVVPGCWVIDYDEMVRTNDIPGPLKPKRFDALVKGYTYRFGTEELTVTFREEPGGAQAAREPSDETFGVDTSFGDDRAVLRVVALKSPPLAEQAPTFGRLIPNPTKVQEADDAIAFDPAVTLGWSPTEPPFAFELEVVDDDTLRSAANFLTRRLWGKDTGPLLLRRVNCAR